MPTTFSPRRSGIPDKIEPVPIHRGFRLRLTPVTGSKATCLTVREDFGKRMLLAILCRLEGIGGILHF